MRSIMHTNNLHKYSDCFDFGMDCGECNNTGKMLNINQQITIGNE